jgi:glycosyltransferase involved in cell wall biosynthesis
MAYVSESSKYENQGKMVDVTVLVPTKNEEIVTEQFIRWCQEGFEKVGLKGEIIFSDFSTDSTAIIAAKLGVHVVNLSEGGVGRAYREAGNKINGKIVLIGDVDCTYDFRDIKPFLEAIKLGNELVIGSRFRGNIEKNSMPFLHRYLGTPVTTFIFDVVHGLNYTDIHCGMRAMTRDTFMKLLPQENGWQYASEMLARARIYKIKTTEIPINFYKSPNNRVSHLKRDGWKIPITEGIGTIVTTFKYGADRLLLALGLTCLVFGLPLLFLSIKQIDILFDVKFSFGAQIMGLGLSCLGSVSILFRRIVKKIYGAQVNEKKLTNKNTKLRFFVMSYIPILLASLLLSIVYLSDLLATKGMLSSEIQWMSGLIAPVVFCNFLWIMQIVILSLEIVASEKINE